MSRFILLPSETKNTFTLVSTEDCMKTKTVELPDELLDMDIFKKVQNRNKANNLLYRISRSGISKTSDGCVKDKNNKHNIQFDEAVIGCCNDEFKECFEEFYCILKKYDIVF